MRTKFRILFIASEIFPLAKTGGLADVCGALPRALVRLGADVRLMMPAYEQALDTVRRPAVVADLGDVSGLGETRLIGGFLPQSDVPIWLVDCPRLFRRPGGPYQDAGGSDWPDNPERYALLCHAATSVALGHAGVGWQPDIVHCHDWHTGLVPLLMNDAPTRPASVFTIHNLAFQGLCGAEWLERLALPQRYFSQDGCEFFGQISFIKAGIRFADKLTTVSPTYAAEIQMPEHGQGLDGLVRARAADLTGILNGIDTSLWDPECDPHIVSGYSTDAPEGKESCKAGLQRECGLHGDLDAPIMAFASRVTDQKMADIALQALPQALNRWPRLQFVLHGSGDRHLEAGFETLAAAFPGRVSVRIGYDEATAHRLHSASDMLLHGSRFEPCGLVQLYAMRYGSAPIVRRVGGLADTVVDYEQDAGSAPPTGFIFEDATVPAMLGGIDRALAIYGRAGDWSCLRRQAMLMDFGWARSAERYMALYRSLRPTLERPETATDSRIEQAA